MTWPRIIIINKVRGMRDNLGETENEVAYENLRTKETLLMLRNNEVAIVEEEEQRVFCVVLCYL